MDAFSYANLAHANFSDAVTFKSALCRGGNLIWHTTMPDGTIEYGLSSGMEREDSSYSVQQILF